MKTTIQADSVTVKITANDKGNPAGKLADAELHFADGPLAGLKLIGFAIWERRGAGGRIDVEEWTKWFEDPGNRRGGNR